MKDKKTWTLRALTGVLAVALLGLLAYANCKTAPDPLGQDPGDPARVDLEHSPTPTPKAIDLTLVKDTTRPPPLDAIQLPRGFDIAYYAQDVPNARSMTLGPGGTVFVSTRRDGRVWALRDEDGDQIAEVRHEIDAKLNTPNGVALREGSLYVAEIDRILRYDDIEANLSSPPEPVALPQRYPSDAHHGWKFIRFGPDGLLYVPVGAPCNVCEKDNPLYSTITRIDVTKDAPPEIFAHGARNSVGFDWNPRTRELWFTDNGRDRMGDDIPPDELNRAPRKGMHFGFPYCHGGDIPDPEFGSKKPCDTFTPPARKLGPHVAGLGMRFYTGGMFPSGFEDQIFIAEHGSWNRSKPLGYRISLVEHDDKRGTSYRVFAAGWLNEDGSRWGRPVDVLVMPDGALLVSDDDAGAIYRISYTPPSP